MFISPNKLEKCDSVRSPYSPLFGILVKMLLIKLKLLNKLHLFPFSLVGYFLLLNWENFTRVYDKS